VYDITTVGTYLIMSTLPELLSVSAMKRPNIICFCIFEGGLAHLDVISELFDTLPRH